MHYPKKVGNEIVAHAWLKDKMKFKERITKQGRKKGAEEQ